MFLILNNQGAQVWVNSSSFIETIKSIIKIFDENQMDLYTITKAAGNTSIVWHPEFLKKFGISQPYFIRSM